MATFPLVVAALLVLLSMALVAVGLGAVRRGRALGVTVALVGATLLLSLGALSATLSIGTGGYRAFADGDLAAVVETYPTGPQSFNAAFTLPDGREVTFSLAGDALTVDAHLLEWKPAAKLLGLRSAFELDRVAGRYTDAEHQQSRPGTAFSLAQDKPVDVFELRRQFPLLRWLVDAQYGSATLDVGEERSQREIRVRAAGLSVRDP